MAAPPRPRASPPALPDELVEETLLRLPPDEPACILRASAVWAWSSVISHPSFRRRTHELHTPPVLGFLHNCPNEHIPRFIPTTASSFSLAAPDYSTWRALDCRHGRALFLSKARIHRNSSCGSQSRAASSLCRRDDQYDLLACLYSSETGTWGEPTSLHGEFDMYFKDYSSVLVGRSLLYFMSDDGFVVEYDLARRSLAVFDALDMESHWEQPENIKHINLVLAEDGGMRVCQVLQSYLKFWKRGASNGPDAQWWVLTWVIDLRNFFLQIGVVLEEGTEVRVVGFAEEANVIIVDTVGGIFTLELQSEKVRKVCDDNGFSNIIPVVEFYIPEPRGDSGPSEEACGEKGGEEEKAVDQPPQLFDNGSNAIEEGDFINAFDCISRDLKIRDYEEVTLEEGGATTLNRYECALLPKDQEVVNLSGDPPKSAPNEESVKRTSSRDDARNSTTSDSNDGCFPTLAKGDFE
ncbi:hypothetical protein ACQ4PT_017660 [Festuca glaucescens]